MNSSMRYLIFLLLLSHTLAGKGQAIRPAEPVSDKNYIKEFLCQEVRYPQKALDNKVEGEVVLSFIVHPDGEVTGITVEKSVSPPLDAEAIRVFRMIRWKPATKMGQPVASRQKFPVNFNVKRYEKHCKESSRHTIEHPYTPVDSGMAIYKPEDLDRTPYPVFEKPSMSLGAFLQSEFRYPEQAFKQSIAGTVEVRFIVEKHGRISNVEIARPIGGGCNEEAVRLISMLRWMPGIKDSLAVRTKLSMNITFRLPGESGHRILDYNFNSSL